METISPLQKLRIEFHPRHPIILQHFETLEVKQGASLKEREDIKSLFPETYGQKPLEFYPGPKKKHDLKNVGVVLSGGQAAGGHNVICGLFDALKKLHPESKLIGFKNGPSGIVDDKAVELTEQLLKDYRNQGGFDLIGSGRTKIETPEQFQAAEAVARKWKLDGLVVIGGDDSNTNAALLAEYFKAKKSPAVVVGVPKTIDGDLKNDYIECSFGFDSASKTFSEIIGNVARDALSQKKYYFFIKIMGRSASHLALESALQTHPNITLIGEEIEAEKKTIRQVTEEICDVICQRAEQKKNYGIVLIPEGVIEFIPECKALIKELNALLAPEKEHAGRIESLASMEEKIDYLSKQLSEGSTNCLRSIPPEIQAQLLLERDPHGNVQVSKIETERLFISTVNTELQNRQKANKYSGKFSAQPLFCGYEGRSCMPSNFDAQYCYALGHVAALLINNKATGYMTIIRKLVRPVEEWEIGAIPLINMIHFEERQGKMKPVIQKALVNLHGGPFKKLKENRKAWAEGDHYCYPGPIQFFGPEKVTEAITLTLALEHQ